jgi:CRP-like cAMP-binding protein
VFFHNPAIFAKFTSKLRYFYSPNLERIEDVQNRYLEVCTEHVDQRIARSLLRLMRRAGLKVPEGMHIDIPLSRQNIADYSGTTLYTVSRTLSAGEKRAGSGQGANESLSPIPTPWSVSLKPDD